MSEDPGGPGKLEGAAHQSYQQEGHRASLGFVFLGGFFTLFVVNKRRFLVG